MTSWTHFTPQLVKAVEEGTRQVINRYAQHSFEHIEDITQDILLIIHQRYFSKGRTLYEAVLRRIIQQDALRAHRRRYYPTIPEDTKHVIQTQLSNLLDQGITVAENGFSGEHFTEQEWDTVRMLSQSGWSLTAASRATGIPLGTLQSRLAVIHYKSATYNSDHLNAAPTHHTPTTQQTTQEEQARRQVHDANTADMLAKLIQNTPSLTAEDRRKLARYMEGSLALSDIKRATRKLRQHAGTVAK